MGNELIITSCQSLKYLYHCATASKKRTRIMKHSKARKQIAVSTLSSVLRLLLGSVKMMYIRAAPIPTAGLNVPKMNWRDQENRKEKINYLVNYSLNHYYDY